MVLSLKLIALNLIQKRHNGLYMSYILYANTLAKAVQARLNGDSILESKLLDVLDEIWDSLSNNDIILVNELSRKISSGELTIEEFISQFKEKQ